jgi:NAD(P)-dependent dehydrogenase (short-subunit alcohol dehydrogenase family)
MAETRALCLDGAPQGTRVTMFVADVAIEAQVNAWAEAVRSEMETDRIHLLFNNAGIGGGGSFIVGERAAWERTFNINFYGVLHGVRAFLPLLMAADAGHIVNTSSVNGFWATLGPGPMHTAYSAAKFAVKGFTEALISDLAINAPHIHCSVVMPGHIGTEIAGNSIRMGGGYRDVRARMAQAGLNSDMLSDEQLATAVNANFRDTAPTSAAEAATIILDGVKAGRWRLLVGADAERLDTMVRADPEAAYTPEFAAQWRAGGA